MITCSYKHRTGNVLFQYFAARLLAEKHNLILNVETRDRWSNWGDYFKILPFTGIKTFSGEPVTVSKRNYDSLYNSLEIKNNLHLHDYFQQESIVWGNEKRIKEILNLVYEPQPKNQVFVIYRLGDVTDRRWMTPYEYYEEALDSLNIDGGYIASDSVDHKFVIKLKDRYNLTIFNPVNFLDTLNMAKNFNNLVTGEGTFCWWAAYLSRAENIFIPGRVFKSLPGWGQSELYKYKRNEWKFLNWDYDINYVDTETWKATNNHSIRDRLIEYRPIKY